MVNVISSEQLGCTSGDLLGLPKRGCWPWLISNKEVTGGHWILGGADGPVARVGDTARSGVTGWWGERVGASMPLYPNCEGKALPAVPCLNFFERERVKPEGLFHHINPRTPPESGPDGIWGATPEM